MDVETFDDIVRGQIRLSEEVLLSKAKEYADDSDRLHNFRVAAQIQGTSQVKALGGMMAKHTVSVYDMIQSGEPYSLEKWEEKIGDHINYLLLLKALVIDVGLAEWDEKEAEEEQPSDCPGYTLREWIKEFFPEGATTHDIYEDVLGRSLLSHARSDWDADRAEKDARIAEAVSKALGVFTKDVKVDFKTKYKFPEES